MPDEGSIKLPQVENLPEPRRTQIFRLMISAMVSEGYIQGAIDAANSLDRELTIIELETILVKQISFGYFEAMEKTLRFLGRSLSEEELIHSIQTLIQQGKLLTACKVAVKLPKDLRIAQLEMIRKEQASIGLSMCVEETDKLIAESI